MLNTTQPETTASKMWCLILKIWWRVFILAAVVFAFYRLRGLVTTLILTAIVAYVMSPFADGMCANKYFVHFHTAALSAITGLFSRNKLSKPHHFHHTIRMLSVLYVLVIGVLIVWWGCKIVAAPVQDEINKFKSPEGQREFANQKQNFVLWWDSLTPAGAKSDAVWKKIQESFDFGEFVKQHSAEAAKSVGELFTAIIEVALIPVLAFYILIDGRKLTKEFVGLMRKPQRRMAYRILTDFNRIMRAYIYGQFMLCIIAAVLVGAWLAYNHTKYTLILAIFAGITRAIPVIGPIFGAIPIVILEFAEKGAGPATAFCIFFAILHIIETKFIMPLLIGDRVELHPVIIIVVLLIGGAAGNVALGNQLGTMLGMFFAAPIAALVRVILRRYYLKLPVNTREKRHKPAPAESEGVGSGE